MQLILPREIAHLLTKELAAVGQREIGGIIMGEHLGPNIFRVTEITIQKRGGTFAFFVRLVGEFAAPLRAFFRKTDHNYTRFNYLGEWHSHHSFALNPSGQDHATMGEIVDDPDLGANFVVLLLVKLGDHDQLSGSVTVYRSVHPPFAGEVIFNEK